MPVSSDAIDQPGKRLHICIGYTCNNNCIFCMEDDREKRRLYVLNQSDGDIQSMINENRNAEEVLFTSGEPTLNEKLPLYIRWARQSGIKTIGIISNGRRMAYRDYAFSLLSEGINNIVISIHGHNSKLHDSLTRTKGSFEQTYRALLNLSELKEQFSFRLATSTVVNKKNLSFIKDITLLFIPLLVDQFIFNVMMPDGRGNIFFNKLMPKYRDVSEKFKLISSELSDNSLKRIHLVDIPFCVTINLPDTIRGYVERFFHYEPEGSAGHKDYQIDPFLLSKIDRNLFERESLLSDSVFTKITRSFKDMLVKEKREKCNTCRYGRICAGVWKPYIMHRGWDEFQPVE
jgi:cyclic pyranopterin phosphate synthase